MPLYPQRKDPHPLLRESFPRGFPLTPHATLLCLQLFFCCCDHPRLGMVTVLANLCPRPSTHSAKEGSSRRPNQGFPGGTGTMTNKALGPSVFRLFFLFFFLSVCFGGSATPSGCNLLLPLASFSGGQTDESTRQVER